MAKVKQQPFNEEIKVNVAVNGVMAATALRAALEVYAVGKLGLPAHRKAARKMLTQLKSEVAFPPEHDH